MNTKKSVLFLCFIAAILTIQSCIKDEDFDYDKMASSSWDPELAVPLVYSSMTIQDLIAAGDTNMISVDSNHLVTLIYRGNIYSMQGSGLFSFDDQTDFTIFNINSSDSTILYNTNTVSKTVSKIAPFIFPNGELIDSLTFKSGSLEIQINSTVPHSGILNVSIPTMTKNGSSFSFDVPFNASAGPQILKIDSMSLSGYFLNLSSTGMPNVINLVYRATYNNSNTSNSVIGKTFNVISNFANMKFSSLFGNLGSTEINMDEDSSEISIFENFQNGSMYFEDPKLTFTITNSIGMSVDANIATFNTISSNGTVVPITGGIPDPLPVGYPTVPGQSVSTSFILDKSNSNIQSIIAQAPKYFVYTLDATTNVPLVPFNFLTDSSQLKADIRIDIPLRGYASGFVISDTVDFALDRIDEIESATFRINVDNGFPVSAITQIYFTDSNYVVLDSMLMNPSNTPIESALVDANGKVTQSTHKMIDEAFDKIRMDHIYSTKKMLIVSTINTKDSPSSNIEIYDNYKMDVRIGVRAKYNYKF